MKRKYILLTISISGLAIALYGAHLKVINHQNGNIVLLTSTIVLFFYCLYLLFYIKDLRKKHEK